MDRDVAMQINSKISEINASLALIATGAAQPVENRNSIESERSAPEEDPEEPEAPEEPETRTKK